jgi:hypothetical protein
MAKVSDLPAHSISKKAIIKNSVINALFRPSKSGTENKVIENIPLM